MTGIAPCLRKLVVSVVLTIAIGGAWTPIYAQSLWSIEEFMERKEKWKDLQETTLRLEGRYVTLGETAMAFEKCDLRDLQFLLNKDVGRTRGNSGVVEVTGHLTMKDGKLVFLVESLSPRLSDLQRVHQMRGDINSEDARDWYRVADWARGRGRFYKDEKLQEEARQLDENGIVAEFRSISPTDERALNELLKKARSMRVSETLLQEIVHEALRAQWARLESRPFSDGDYRDFAVRIAAELLGATTQLDAYPAQRADQYAAHPKAVYHAADSAQRLILDRLFYLTVMTKRILESENSAGGFRIVDRLKAEVPERTELINEQMELALKSNLSRIDVTMTRSELEQLVARLEKEGHADQALEAKRNWLLVRESPVRKEGARSLAELADQWLSLLHDSDAASRLYIEAWRSDHDYLPASEWLMLHGYRLVNDQWLLESEIPVVPKSSIELAMEQGVVVVGMTAAQARTALGVLPNSVTRIATSRMTTEIWAYDSVIIRLSRPYRSSESSVVAVERIQQAPERNSDK